MIGRRSRILALGVALSTGAAGGCARSVLSPPQPEVVDTGWVLHEIPDAGLLVSTPGAFEATGVPGCFEGHVQDTLPHGPGWRSFCLGLHPLDQPIPLFVEGPSPPDCRADCVRLDEVRTTRMTLGRQEVIVQTALVSGGLAGRPRAPEMLVQMPIARGLALLRAQYGDREDAAVILGIAQTVTTR